MSAHTLYFRPEVANEIATLVGTTTGPAVLACTKGHLTLTAGGTTYGLGAHPAMPARIEITDPVWVARGLAAGLPFSVEGSEVRVGHVSCTQTAGRAYYPSVASTEPPVQPLFRAPAGALRGFPSAGYLYIHARRHAACVVMEGRETETGWVEAPSWCRLSAGPVSAAAAGGSSLFFLVDGSAAVVGGRRVGIWSGGVRRY